MEKERAYQLLVEWGAATKKLNFIKEELPSIPEEETALPEGTEAEDFTYIPLAIEELKKPRDYLCIVHKGQVISQGQIPILFHKTMKEYCRNIAYELEGVHPFKDTHIRRADKVINGLIKLGFTPQHKITIFTLKESKHIINYKEKEKAMPSTPRIKVIEILYDDNRRTVKTNPTDDVLRLISAEIRPSTVITAQFKADTHIVFKREYFKKTPAKVLEALVLVEDFYKTARIEAGKPISPNYFVVNEDEPYAGQILNEILVGETLKGKLNVVTEDSTDENTEAGDGVERDGEDNLKGEDDNPSAPNADSEREE